MTDMTSIQFDNGAIKMAGNLYFPDGFDNSGSYPAIVCVHPGGGVKEQTAGLYAERLAEHGFVGHQSCFDRTADQGVGTVSAVDVGAATRKGWDGTASESDQIANLEAVAAQRTAEVSGAEPVYGPYVPAVGDTTAPRDLQEAADCYLTPRGQHPNAQNKMLMTSLSYLVSFTGFDLVETFLTQPLLVIAGSEAGSLWHSEELYAKAPGPKELVLVDGATHMDLYDGPRVEEVVAALSPFFANNLGDPLDAKLTASAGTQSR
jgi:uncharacterized protein